MYSIFTIGIGLLLITNAYALENDNSYITENQGSAEDVALNEKNLAERDASLQKFIEEYEAQQKYQTRGAITDTRIGWLDGYPIYEQINRYYCGPATIKQAIQYITGSSASQETYGSNMGTNSEKGTYVYKMTQELKLIQRK